MCKSTLFGIVLKFLYNKVCYIKHRYEKHFNTNIVFFRETKMVFFGCKVENGGSSCRTRINKTEATKYVGIINLKLINSIYLKLDRFKKIFFKMNLDDYKLSQDKSFTRYFKELKHHLTFLN